MQQRSWAGCCSAALTVDRSCEKGVFHAAKYGLPHLVKSQGVLVNTGSTFGMVGAHYASAYCASKGGVINLTRQLAVDYGPLGALAEAAGLRTVH